VNIFETGRAFREHHAVAIVRPGSEGMQKTLILFKPEAIERGLVGVILERFERAGLRVEQARSVRPALALLQAHYDDLKTRHPSAFARTTEYLADKPFVAMILTGQNAIAKARQLLGATDPLAAMPGSIRGDFSCDTLAAADAEQRAALNLVHAADSEAAVKRETGLWFRDWEEE
jgi:nucleoside-diphosphate kinase